MKSLWIEDRKLRLRADLPVPTPPPGEALVRVVTAGICNTDLELMRGYYPFCGVLGHEFVGIVERGPPDLEGRRVVGEINAVCGECSACRAGRRSHCESRTVLGIVNRHGAFAEYLTLPIENLHEVPDEVSTDRAVFTEPVAAALRIEQQVEVRTSDRVLVVGDGKLGLLVAQALATCGCDLVAIGRHDEKLAILRARGIRVGSAEDVSTGSIDLAIECTGNSEGFALARRALRPCGTLVMKSTYAGELTFDASSLVVDEINLIGSRCGPFAPALELLARDAIDVDSLVHARFPLDDALAAFDRASTKGTLKVLLDIE
ncbi:MAG: alcohol dehydrogenase catalytic domain-containing protein [Acidobacteriota bacterium]|nr:alcohol dehydrogenase catalytic domain-containing protein [Acidobacteriota bacterium]